METELESSDPAEHQSAPALLPHDDGQTTILPTQHLPGVDCGAHLKTDGEKLVANDSNMEGREPRKPAGSYSTDRSAEDGGHVDPSTKSNTTQDFDREPADRTLERVHTAPVDSTQRPKPSGRSSTLRQALTRRQQNPEGFQYAFDPMSSESESTSSDEGEKAPKAGQRRKPKRAQSAAELKEAKQEKENAKQGRSYSRFKLGNEHFNTRGKVSEKDGRLDISINETANSGYLAKALGQTIKHHLDIPNRQRVRKQRQHAADHPTLDAGAEAERIASSLHTTIKRPAMNVVIMVIGSRGDIQPFLKIGKILREQYGHRVRLATHPIFRDFVEKETDLEFFSVGGNPSELMAFMVKNPGLVPGLETIREGEIGRRRRMMGEMFSGMWRACTNATDDESDPNNLKTLGEGYPFVADAIIANPPSMAHVHIAERLGIPLHIMFTFPYSPTQAFPHPLANIKQGKSNVDASYANFMSYPLVEMMTWSGLGDIVNKFRQRDLGLEPVSSLWAPGALYRMKVPYTYMWSPSLVPKPNDWGPEIDISGFVFMELAQNFEPPQDLVDFLDAGEPPVYIGFGSIVVDDPNSFTNIIIDAVKIAGVRALVNKGWGGLGTSNENTPDSIFMLGNTPHDWLFPKCKAVVHHGGAGTTAIGLKCAKPTMIVPFFGDQAFWAARVAEAKAGAHQVIPWRQMTAEKLAEGIKQCLTDEAQRNVQKMADGMAKEGDGAVNACKSFHRSLPLAGKHNMRCSILEDRVAKWTLKGSTMRLSALAAEILIQQGKVKPGDLKLYRVYSWNDFDGPGEPISGTVGALTDSFTEIGSGVGMVPIRVARHMRKRAEHQRKKLEVQQRKQKRQEEKQQRRDGKAGAVDGSNDPRPQATRENTNTTTGSALSADPTTPWAMELVRDFGEGFKRSGTALLTMPNDLHVAIAQGFHNAPRLWGDATVRKPMRITGFKSGCVAGGRELGYGIYDAWTGLVTQPVGGFRDGDTIPAKVSGFGMGFAKGLGGFVLKNVSAVVSPPACVGKGVIVYVKKRAEGDGPSSKAAMRKAHLVLGQIDYKRLQEEGKREQLERIRERVSEGWRVYEEIWEEAAHEYGPVGGNVIGRMKLGREKRRWAEAGALENVDTAKDALAAFKRGVDMQRHLARRKEEMQLAEEPRAPAMEQPLSYEEGEDVLPNGRRMLRKTEAEDGGEKKKKKGGEWEDAAGQHAAPREHRGSESTVVATSEDSADEMKKHHLPAADDHHHPSDTEHGDVMAMKKLAASGGGPEQQTVRSAMV
ncbi:glycosyltransferase family 1 [Lecanosticta acicola]|uniref:Glycosyltransferase family 1 n=1 Tax=Lecanosticta acicola TaxID=111012 RepID=A0AAI9EDY3_9PEZI|nr:glycosyltransferase family 1 [Lecanosticta acicola]